MGARDLVTVDINKFEELLADSKLSITEAADSWGIARASLQKIRAGTPISKALATKIMLRSRSKDSILVLQDKHAEDVLSVNLKPFFRTLIRPGDRMYEPEENYPRELEIDIIPANQPNWISPNDPDPNAKRTAHWLTDSVRLQKCDEISLTKLSRTGRHFAMTVCNWTGEPTYSEKQLDAVWHCVQGTYLSYDAIEHLKTIREILKTPNRAELVGATLDDIIDAATSQSGLAEAIENLENEGVAIFGQRIATFLPWEDYNQYWQGIGCDKAEHGFLLIAGSEFDAAELTYSRWVNGSIYKERTSIAKIEQLNRTNDFE